MEITKYVSKKNLIYISIIIIILIILRILYNQVYSNTEGFDVSNNAASDLLSKLKSAEAQYVVDTKNPNLEMQIYSWSNQLYNIQNISNQTKAIAFYKPNLLLKDIQYAKLGDIVSQNSDYSLPSVDQFTLLVKKLTSDIKPPERFELVAEIVNPTFDTSYYEFSNYVTNTVKLNIIKKSLTNCANIVSILDSIIQKNLTTIKNGFVNYIYTNYYINSKISIFKFLRDNRKIVEGFEGDYNDFIPTPLIDTTEISDKNNVSFNLSNTPVKDVNYTESIGTSTKLWLPAGITGYLNLPNGDKIDIVIPSDLDSDQTSKESKKREYMMYNKLSGDPFGKLGVNNIHFAEISRKIFSYVPIIDIVNCIISLCNDISNIYNNQSKNKSKNRDLLTYLKLTPSLSIIKAILTIMESYSNNINEVTLQQIENELSSLSMNTTSITNDTTKIELILYIIFRMEIRYTLTYLYFSEEELSGIKNLGGIQKEYQGCFPDSGGWYTSSIFGSNQIVGSWWNRFYDDTTNAEDLCAEAVRNQNSNYNTFGVHGERCYAGVDTPFGGTGASGCGYKPGAKWSTHVYKIKTNKLTITNFNNDIVSYIPNSMYSILSNPTFTTKSRAQESISKKIAKIINNINKFVNFVNDITNNKIGDFPIQIYKPIAPDNYTTMGHIFCNISSDLDKIINSNNIACVPSHCVKEIRDWTTNDKIYEYNKNGKYFAIYFNPYTGTFVSTNVNAQKLPDGKMCKVIACVAKCNAVEDLEKADDCARKYYNINKQSLANTPLTSSLVSSKEEEYYLDKLQTQSDSITRLKQRAQRMQTDVDKATIVNREMNQNKLQDYVDVQKRNIDIIMKRLQDDKNKIKTDVNISEDTLNALMQMIQNSNSLSSEQKATLLKKITNSQKLPNDEYDKNFSQILASCPQYDLSELVTKQKASDVCFGCDTPK